jgi:type IV secretory pathway TrbD component
MIITGKRFELVTPCFEKQYIIAVGSCILPSAFTPIIFRLTERIQHTTLTTVIGFVLKMWKTQDFKICLYLLVLCYVKKKNKKTKQFFSYLNKKLNFFKYDAYKSSNDRFVLPYKHSTKLQHFCWHVLLNLGFDWIKVFRAHP